jgi:hypothetical protein
MTSGLWREAWADLEVLFHPHTNFALCVLLFTTNNTVGCDM